MRQLTIKVVIPELETQKVVIVNPLWTCRDAFTKIIQKMVKHFPEGERQCILDTYTLKTHGIFLTPYPVEGYKSSSFGLWMTDDEVLEDYDLVNQVPFVSGKFIESSSIAKKNLEFF